MINIQMQDGSGNWITYYTVNNNSQNIIMGMNQLSRQFPNNRIRAADSNGRVVDIL